MILSISSHLSISISLLISISLYDSDSDSDSYSGKDRLADAYILGPIFVPYAYL